MKRVVLLIALFLCYYSSPIFAGISITGDVDLIEPTPWDSLPPWVDYSYVYVGETSDGTLTIDGGSDLASFQGNIGLNSGSRGTVTVDGAGSTWDNRGYLSSFSVGNAGDGTLNITNGGKVSSSTSCIASFNNSTGTVTVDGESSIWDVSGYLPVGYRGNGTLNISGGGSVVVDRETFFGYTGDSTGTINFDNGTLNTRSLFAGMENLTGTGTTNTNGLVSDVDLVFDSTDDLSQTLVLNENAGQNVTINLDVDGSGWMGAGYSSVGTLSISNGVSVQSEHGFVGYKAGSTGTVTVDGAGSTWDNSAELRVGENGNGTLNITNGGNVSNDVCYVGMYSTGVVAVDGAGSVLDYGGMGVGQYSNANGMLTITNGGVANGGSTSIGHSTDATGTVTVGGIGSVWNNSGILRVGVYGSGELKIINGGVVSNDSFGRIGVESGTGVVKVDGIGSAWESGAVYVGYGYGSSGTLSVTNGGIVTNRYGIIGQGYGGSTGTVTVDGSGSRWINSDYLYVGRNGDGILNIFNDGLVSVAGDLSIGSGGFVNMREGGTLALFGEADDSLIEFLDLIGGTDAIRYWDEFVMDWADITGATYGLDYTLSYIDSDSSSLDGYTILTVPEPCSLALLSLGAFALRRRRT